MRARRVSPLSLARVLAVAGFLALLWLVLG